MYTSNEIIQFELNNVKFTLSDFHHQKIISPNPLHYHNKDCIEIHYIKSGSGTVILNEIATPIEEDSFFITGPFVVHGQIPDSNEYIEKYSIYFTVENYQDNQLLSNFFSKPSYIGKSTNYDLSTLFNQIQSEFQKKQFGYKEVIAETIKILMILILRNFDIYESGNNDNNLIHTRFQIEKIFLNEFKDITLPILTKKLSMGEKTLQRFLSKHYNKNFSELKLEAKMFYAANQLLYTKNSITSISQETGYSSPEHFSYAFVNFYNITPLNYRKEKKNNIHKAIHLNLS